jgi:hypothetical protein
MVMGSRKGGSFERHVANSLSAWSGVQREFIRERFGYSDIKSPRDFPFSIECKNRNEVDFLAMVTRPKTSTLLQALGQTLENSAREGKLPMIVFRQTSSKDMAILPDNAATEVVQRAVCSKFPESVIFRFSKDKQSWYCFLFSHVLDSISYKDFCVLYAKK